MILVAAMPLVLSGVLIVGGTIVLVVVGLLVVRRLVPVPTLRAHNDVAGFIFATLGVIYAVLLALVVVAIWEQFRDAEQAVQREAALLSDLAMDADALPGAMRQEMRERAVAYARSVIADEWPRLAYGEPNSTTRERFQALWESVRRIESRSPSEAVLHAEMLRRMNDLNAARAERVLASRADVPGILWAMLLFGGIITVAYTYLYGVENLIPQALMTSALAGMIALVLFVVLAMDHPFTGDVRVTPEAFELVLKSLE